MQQPAVERVVDCRRARAASSPPAHSRRRISACRSASSGKSTRGAWHVGSGMRPAASSSARAPSRRTATVSTTGTPSSRCSGCDVDADAATRARHPSCSAPAASAGPAGATSSTKRRCRRRLVASTTQTSRSGRGSPGMKPRQQVAGDRFVGAGGVEAVGAGQVEHAHAGGRRACEAAFLALDGDAGVVGDLLATAGERVEQRGLAAVRVADQGDARDRGGLRAVMRRCRSVRKRTRAASTAAQGEAGVADLHQQRLGAEWTARRRSAPASPATKPSSRRRRAIASFGCEVVHVLDDGRRAPGELGQISLRQAKWELFAL